MRGEEFYEPTKGELDWAMEKAREDMGEPGEPKITDEKVNRVMKEVAAQFSEKFEPEDPTIPESEIVAKYEKEGWRHVDTITNAARVSVGDEEGKKIKVIELGDKYLVFKK